MIIKNVTKNKSPALLSGDDLGPFLVRDRETPNLLMSGFPVLELKFRRNSLTD